MDILYLVEFRKYNDNKIETDPAFLATSIENAKKFMSDNKDYDGNNKNFWWAVYPMPIDKDPQEENLDELYLFNRKLERIYWQYKNVIELNQVCFFNLIEGEFSYLNNYMFKGKLVDTEDEKLTFKNIQCFKNDEIIKTKEIQTYDLSDLLGVYQDEH